MDRKRKKPLLTVTISQNIYDMIMEMKENSDDNLSVVVEKLLRKGLGVGDFDKDEKVNMTWYDFDVIHDRIGRVSERVDLLEYDKEHKDDIEEQVYEGIEESIEEIYGELQEVYKLIRASDNQKELESLKKERAKDIKRVDKLTEEIKKLKSEIKKINKKME